MTVQYPVWALGIVQILRYRRKARRAALEADPDAYAAMQAGRVRHLPLTPAPPATTPDPRPPTPRPSLNRREATCGRAPTRREATCGRR